MLDHYLYFDQNLLNLLLRSHREDGFKKLDRQLDDLGISINKNNVLQTPFSVLELLGVRIKIDSSGYTSINESNIVKQIGILSKEIINASEFFLKSINFHEMALCKSKFIDASNSKFYWSYVSQILHNKSFYALLIRQILNDRLSVFSYREKDRVEAFWNFFYPLLISNESRVRNYSFFRLAVRFWNSIYRLRKKCPKGSLDSLSDFHSFITRESKDFVDCELIHYAVSGFFYSGVYSPVIVFTMDKAEDLSRRVLFYKKFYADVIANEIEPKFYQLSQLHKSGFIFFVDENYQVTQRLDVSQV